MNWFHLINQTLINENIDPNTDTNIPEQFYFKNYSSFHEKINDYLKSILPKNTQNKNIFILSDGKFKLAEINHSLNATDHVIQSLDKSFNIIHKVLSLECNVSPEEIHASEYFLKKIIQLVKAEKNCSIFIALGSGTITDLLKHALFLNYPKSIFISIPTAMTVTAFTSSFSVVDIDGAKRTRQSKCIRSTFWIEPLLQAAPIQLSRAGYGDLLARFVAYGDWYLSYKLGVTDKYDELAYRLMEIFAEPLKKSANDFGQDILSSEATEVNAASLAMAGIAMSLSGETTPLSGYEHVISHALDFLRITSNRPLVLHGEQVALAALTSAMSFDWFIELNEFDIKKMRILSEKEAEKLINQFISEAPFFGVEDSSETIKFEKFTQVKKLFVDDYMLKSNKWNLAKENFGEFQKKWVEIKEHLVKITMRSQEMTLLLEQAKLPTYPEATVPSTSALEYRWALRFAPFVRTRFCIADLIFWIGEDTCVVAAI